MQGIIFTTIVMAAVILGDSMDESAILEAILNNYNPEYTPVHKKIDVGLYVNELRINAEEGAMILDAYIRHSWNDQQLLFSDASIDRIIVPDRLVDKIWRPDIFFKNARDIKIFTDPVSQFLMRLHSNGDVWYVYRANMELRCPGLKIWNHRTVLCPVMFESFKYMTSQVYFDWLSSPVEVDPQVQIDDYQLTDKILYDCTQNFTVGAFPCLEIAMQLERNCLFC